MDEQFDAIIVGGGLSGLAAAYTLAKAGKEVVLVEKGDYCGAKNVTGGRLYVSPIRELFPDLWKKAPLERPIVKEEISMMSQDDTVLISYAGKKIAEEPYQSYSVCRAKFDKWFAKQAERAGANIITKYKADSLVFEGNQVVGIKVDDDELRAHVVICCDGVLSFFPEQAGLKKHSEEPLHYAVGVKEVIEMPQKLIEDRFGLQPGTGAARLYMGDCTAGKFGGGFIYTNKESISLGLVIGVQALMNEPIIETPVLFDRFKQKPEIAALIEGCKPVEYSAHVIAEGGYKNLNSMVGPGVLAAGDAVGLSFNGGLVVRGMDYAMASGYYAAQAVIAACDANDYSQQSLSVYEKMLKESFVLKDFKESQGVPDALNHDRFFNYYPELLGNLMGDLFTVPNGPKQRIYPTMRKHLGFGDIKTILMKDMKKVTKL